MQSTLGEIGKPGITVFLQWRDGLSERPVKSSLDSLGCHPEKLGHNTSHALLHVELSRTENRSIMYLASVLLHSNKEEPSLR